MSFFVLGKAKAGSPEDLKGGIDITQAKDTQTGGFQKCPRCGCPLTMREWLPPYRVELETWGKAFGDIAILGDALVVSERFVRLFKENKLTGLAQFQPVDVIKITHHRYKIDDTQPAYFKTGIRHSSTAVDQKLSGYRWRHPSQVCPICVFGGGGDLRRYDRIHIDETTWNGDDVFWPHGGTRVMVSGRFKDVCEKSNILGVTFDDPEFQGHDYYPWETAAEMKGENGTGPILKG